MRRTAESFASGSFGQRGAEVFWRGVNFCSQGCRVRAMRSDSDSRYLGLGFQLGRFRNIDLGCEFDAKSFVP